MPASSEGFLAVVEGYTDVMMAHQYGVTNVVATMGTALNAKHVYQLRRYVPRVVLVFDADAGGATGVDRALELFISQDVETRDRDFTQGLGPVRPLTAQGAGPFNNALKNAVDALDFKVNQLLEREDYRGIDGTKRMVDAILGIFALAPEMPGKAGLVKRELILTRVSHRLGLRLETVWARFGELRDARKKDARPSQAFAELSANDAETDEPKAGPAPSLERELLQHLLADPSLVPLAAREIKPEELTHDGLRRLLSGLYQLRASGEPPELDGLRAIIASPALIAWAMDQQEIGRHNEHRKKTFAHVLERFREAARGPRIGASEKPTERRLRSRRGRRNPAETSETIDWEQFLNAREDLTSSQAFEGRGIETSRGGVWMELKIDDSLKALIELGKRHQLPDLGPGQRADSAGHDRAGAPRPDPRDPGTKRDLDHRGGQAEEREPEAGP